MIIFLDSHNDTVKISKDMEYSGVILADFTKKDKAFAMLEINMDAPSFLDEETKTIRFESRKDHDYMALHIPDLGKEDTFQMIEAYITNKIIIIISDQLTLKTLKSELEAGGLDLQSAPQILVFLFNYILRQNISYLDQIDNEIEELEDRATGKRPDDPTPTINHLRKQLSILKHYYGSLYDALDQLTDNRNTLFTEEYLQIFRAQKNKANRLYNSVISLKDYLVHVREAYQNQWDINLNETMRFFTVITAIFLPLTLIVGWYGMNLTMPELKYSFTYPIIVIVCSLFVVVSLIFCKRKGWF